MADKLIFPIGFDLESGLKQAQIDINRTVRRLEDAIKSQSVKLPVGFDAVMAKRLREEAKDIERVLANIKNHYGNGQLKGLSIGFINTQKELEGIKRLNAQLQSMREQRTSLVNAGATEQELKRIDSAIKQTEQRLKELNHAFNRDNSFNVAISQQIVKLKILSEELAGIDRMYARLQASAGAAGRSANTFETNEMLARRKEIMEEIAKVTRTATEAQKELFNIKGVGIGASQSTFGYGGEQGLSAITAQIERYEQLKKELQDVEGQYERLKAMQAQGMGDQSEKINQTLQRRIAIQKELGDITQTAAQAQKALEENAKKTAVAFQRGRSAIDNFNRTMKLPENRIMNIQAKINALNQALKRVGIGSTEFNKIVAELNRLGQKLDEAKAKQQALSSEQEKGIKKATGAFREQKSYLNILIQRLAVYSSMGAVMGFLTKVREVTAQFELQRVSLGAIINDQVKANALFNEIKQFALQSPIKILDLTKYTKQMAAFRFETDTLFESTKRMADISVGLSVPMDRLIYALGHVKAATHLTGITLRQFSMAGIPMLELLAEKYSELEGRAVSVADVQKRVHDKMVSFEDVNQIFTDFTSKGGMFYNMQIEQGNTLYGLWAKLGDAASVMYEQIGNTPFVNEGMKDAINMLTIMMRNWRDVARVATEAGIAFGIYKLAVMASTKATALATVWNKKDILLRQMHLKTVMAQSWSVRNFNKVLLASGVGAQKASTATWVFSRALNGLRAAIATTGIGLLVVGIGLLIDRLIFGKSAADELAESLDRIKLESSQEQDKSVANFERLANVATSSTSSYKQQQEALEELRRTYKGMISEEMLTIENLKSLNGHYEQLTASVRAYINEQMKQKQIDEITNTYAYDILKIQRKVRDDLKNKYSDEQLTEFWDRFAQNVKDKTKSAGKSISDLVNLTVSEMGASMQFAHDIGARWSLSDYEFGFDTMYHVAYLIRQQASEVEAIGKLYDSSAMAMGKFADSYNEAVNSIKENGVSLNGNILNEKDNPLLFSQQEANLEVKDAMVPTIKEAFKEAGMAFDDGWVSLIDNIDENAPHLTSSINFEPMIEKAKSESKRLQDELQKQLELLIAQREAYMKQIQAEEGKGKGKNDEAIANMKAQYNSLGESIAELEEKAKSVNAVLPLLDSLRKKFENIAPSDPVVKIMRKRFDQIVDYTKSYAKNMRRFRMDADESMEAYRKRLTDEVDLIKKNIKAWTAAMVLARLFRNKTEEQNLQNLISEAKLQLADLEKILGDMPEFEKSKGSGRQSDPRLSILQEMVSTLKQVNKEYDELVKKEGATKALSDTQEKYANTFKYLQSLATKYKFKLPDFGVPTDAKSLTKYLDAVKAAMAKLPKSEKAVLSLETDIADIKMNESQKKIEAHLKSLADRISRTKTAKEFYDKILSQTGDIQLAANLTFSIYGENGEGLEKQMADQVRQIVGDTVVKLPDDIISLDDKIDYKALRKFAIKNEKELGGMYDRLIKIADDGEKGLAKIAEQGAKLLLTYDEIAQKRVNIEQEASDKIRQLREAERVYLESDATKEQKQAYSSRTTKVINGINADKELQLLKLQSRYMRFFSAIHSMSHKEAADMRKQIRDAIQKAFREGKMSVDEFRRELKSVDEAFDKLDRDQGVVMDYLSNGFDGLLDRLRSTAEEVSNVGKELYELGKNGETINELGEIFGSDGKKTGKLDQGQIDFINNILGKFGNKSTGNSFSALLKNCNGQLGEMGSKMGEVGAGMEGMANGSMDALAIVDTIIKAVDSTIRGIAQIRDQLNALRSEDHQLEGGFWDGFEYLENFNQYAASGWEKLKGGDFIGAAADTISSIISIFGTAHTQKVKKLNDQIEEQERLLEDLEYTYSRLEKAMDKAFGVDYISNFKQQQQNLQAQAAAYQKQAQLEREKGKGADEDKIRDFESKYRETMDKIADMQGQIAAQMLGTDLTSAARDFAKAWLDAYKEFGNTADAMSEKFHEMIENMIVESLLARVMEKALQPAFKMIDEYNGDFMDAGFWKEVSALAAQGAEDANYGAQTMMKFLEQAGVNIRDLGGDLTGISRDIATASEESINGLSAHMNTVEYYVAQIHHNVAAMAMRELDNMPESLPAVDYTPLIQQSLENQSMLVRNTAEAVVECRRSAVAAEATLAEIRRVIVPKGNKGTHYVYVGM